MKKLLIIFSATIFTLMSCIGQSAKNENTAQNATNPKTIKLSKSEFLTKVVDYESNSKEWKYLGDKPAIIDFYADWCRPCKITAPILEELAQKYDGELYIYKVDIDKETDLAAAFGITSIPTLLFIPMGENPQLMRGAAPKNELDKAINEVLLKK